MARVHVENDIYIDVEFKQCTLERKSIVKEGDNKGKEVFNPVGYYGSLGGALRAALRLKVVLELSKSAVNELSDLAEIVQRSEEEIIGLIEI
ncbi:hypothetical protein [Paenibacillus sedimenti]|uniref:DUF5405 domain-containing protein n=1 Tax=Paenibacillus sedimenti TaxID=2770274 RepID=A0A926KSH8_9BACL|nr:hypothetical protein [Paenibacillus sedimenti]MBD0381230.1 hypothetical protein [Paenibacillus sedimenti]